MSRGRVAMVMALGVLAMAPTPGDIGGCGQPAEPLDAELFFSSLEATDCGACQRCGLGTKTCELACAPAGRPTFPEACEPLAHDGEVCLRRLQATGCDEYRPYVADDEAGGAVLVASRPRPTECQFCPPREP